MSVVKSWNQLVSTIEQRVSSVVKGEVANKVKSMYRKHIKEDVYSVYSPTTYERRIGNGGLLGEENIVSSVVNGTVLEVKNIAAPSESITAPPTPYSPNTDTQFASWVENGSPYKGKAVSLFPTSASGSAWTKPRRFTANTIKELVSNKEHVLSLKQGLKKRGLKLK